MKKFTTLFMLALLIGSLKAQQSKPLMNTAVIEFDRILVKYDTVECGSNPMREVHFKNTGSAPLIITGIDLPCGCQNADWPREPIKSGGSGLIKIYYDTKRVGAFTKIYTVHSNASEPAVPLKATGYVKPPKKEEEPFPGK